MIKDLPASSGVMFALLAAALFGASTPLIQRLGGEVSPWMTAALLYAGAAGAGWMTRSTEERESALHLAHLPRLLLMALCGAMLGPALLAWGLQHTSSVSASLMLTLEAVFTVMLAHWFYREPIGRRVALAIALITLGAAVLVLDRATGGAADTLGLVAVFFATLAWGLDNTLSRSLADADPGKVVLAKAGIGAAGSLLLAWLIGWSAPRWSAALGLFLIGAAGYGLSLRCYLLAQRSFGAARTGSVFAAAPFIGGLVAFAIGEQRLSAWLIAAAALMVAGVIVHFGERHRHRHAHVALAHEHAHTHDDDHHMHVHDPMPTGSHSHWHRHDSQLHDHPHVPDLHHSHGH
jgi:drug/metabolite transporter (DMT)-like permease